MKKIKIMHHVFSGYTFLYVLAILSFLFPFGSTAISGSNTGIGYHGAAFLRVSPNARQVGMGEAASALADDINLMRYNIGGLGNLRHIQLAANFHDWIDDTQQGSISIGLPSRWGVFGFNFAYFNEGKITELNENFNETGGVAYSGDILMNAGYGTFVRILNNDFGFGGSLKLIRQNLAGEQSTAIAIDLGTHFRLKTFSFGATIQNFGLSKVKFENQKSSIPETYRLGAATRLPLAESIKLNIASDISWTTAEKLRYFVGGEVDISDLLAVRAGYQLHSVAVSPLSFGFGLYIPMEWLANSRTRLDYSYSPMDALESTAHRFSLLFSFGATQRVMALNESDRRRIEAINERLRKELAAAEEARLKAQQAEKRTKKLEEEIAKRLARIQKIAAESEGKIEVEPQTKKKILVSMRINFDFDKANIRPEEFKTMEKVGEILNTYPEAKVHVSGHTDSLGPDEYNIRLSQRRVDSVMAFLSKKEGINADRFYMPIGYGEMKPIATNATPEGRFRNRRVEFLLFTFDAVPEMPEGSAIKYVDAIDNNTMRIVCNGKVQFTTHSLDKPDRFIVDFPGIFLLTDQKTFDLNRGPFIKARVGYHPKEKFSRVVFDLNKGVQLEATTVDNAVIVKVK